jgi:hypothetical protein
MPELKTAIRNSLRRDRQYEFAALEHPPLALLGDEKTAEGQTLRRIGVAAQRQAGGVSESRSPLPESERGDRSRRWRSRA